MSSPSDFQELTGVSFSMIEFNQVETTNIEDLQLRKYTVQNFLTRFNDDESPILAESPNQGNRHE